MYDVMEGELKMIEQLAVIINNILELGEYTIGESTITFKDTDFSIVVVDMDESVDCDFLYQNIDIGSVHGDDFGDFIMKFETVAKTGFVTGLGVVTVDDIRNNKLLTLDQQQTFNFDDDSDEVSDDKDWEDENYNGVESIVPYDITKIRVVALKLDNTVLAYRFKTDKGSFDMRRSVALKYGLGDFKVTKMIRLQRVNGLLMTDGEHSKRVLIPDVSDCEEDCKRLMQFMFELN
jgi:hypothetical protein